MFLSISRYSFALNISGYCVSVENCFLLLFIDSRCGRWWIAMLRSSRTRYVEITDQISRFWACLDGSDYFFQYMCVGTKSSVNRESGYWHLFLYYSPAIAVGRKSMSSARSRSYLMWFIATYCNSSLLSAFIGCYWILLFFARFAHFHFRKKVTSRVMWVEIVSWLIDQSLWSSWTLRKNSRCMHVEHDQITRKLLLFKKPLAFCIVGVWANVASRDMSGQVRLFLSESVYQHDVSD